MCGDQAIDPAADAASVTAAPAEFESRAGNADEGRSQMPETMQAIVCHGPEDYRISERPVPVPGVGEAVISVEAVGICASDSKCFHGAPLFWGDEHRAAYVEPPVTAGHEFVGRIERLGAEAAARWGVVEGDRVVAEQIVPCEKCRYCRRGQSWLCEVHEIFGFKQATQGAMADYALLPRRSRLHKIDAAVPAAHAAFAEPLSCSLHAVERGAVGMDDVVVVAGAGPIGLGMVAGAHMRGPLMVIAIDLSASRRDLALRCGADLALEPGDAAYARVAELTEGYGCDVYLDATGHPDAVEQGLRMLRKAGTFVEYGVFRDPVTVDWTIIGDMKELDIRGAHLGAYCWPVAIRMIENGVLPLDDIVTHQLPLTCFGEGMDLVSDGTRSVKVTLIPGS